MTFIEEQIHEIKCITAKHFGISFDLIDRGTRAQKIIRLVSDARKCAAYIIREMLPEVPGAKIDKSLNKKRGYSRHMIYEAKIILQLEDDFLKKYNDIVKEIKENRKKCYYCKSIIK